MLYFFKGFKIKEYKLVILGAGASALMLATKLSDDGFKDTLIIDHNPKIGMKIKISGGGKCNVTNEDVDFNNYLGDSSFVDTILKQYTPFQLLKMLQNRNVSPKIRSLGQYFCKKSADEVIDALKIGLNESNFLLLNKIKSVVKEDFFIITTDKKQIKAKYLVVATGSSAYPQVGGSDIGLTLAKSFGHEVENFSPALVGWTVQKDQFWMKELSGISTRVSIDVGVKKLYGELLFAHKGISGPSVLSASLYWKKGLVYIDFLPDISLKEALSQKKKQISTQLGLSKRLAKKLLQSIEVEDKIVDKLNNKDYEKLALLKKYPLSPAGNFGLKKAEACRGGVKTDFIDADSMQSKVVNNLYFIGEVLDVTGELGGYNFQWAFSSAVVAYKDLKNKLIKE